MRIEAYVLLGRRSMKLADLESVPKTGIEQLLTYALQTTLAIAVDPFSREASLKY